jgi:hypothetical protein
LPSVLGGLPPTTNRPYWADLAKRDDEGTFSLELQDRNECKEVTSELTGPNDVVSKKLVIPKGSLVGIETTKTTL